MMDRPPEHEFPPEDYKPTPTNQEIWERLEALTKQVESLRQSVHVLNGQNVNWSGQ